MTALDVPAPAVDAPSRSDPWWGTVRSQLDHWQDRWRDTDSTTRTRIQVGAFLAAVVVAYHYSLTTLLQSLNLDTPLAYVGLVPFIALGLAAVRSRPATVEPAIHDRQVDYIIGLPLMGTALAINLLLPKRMSAMFWVWRIDLLSMPFFVAGVAAIIFGVRALWRQRLAVGYLFLAWPLPYTALLIGQLNAVTNITLHGLQAVVRVTHIGARAPFSDGSVFNIVYHGRSFPLSVVSACSGVNGMVGFLLVGAAFGATVAGPRRRKAVWLVGGLALLWVMNLGRLLFIFWVGQQFGEHFAIKVLHPYVGLVTFNIGVIIMLLLLKPFGLRIGAPKLGSSSNESAMVEAPLSSRAVAVPRVYSAVAVVVALSMVLGMTNSHLRTYDLVARADGEPKLASFLAYPAAPAGWGATFATEYTFAKPFFGESSAWYRYSFGTTVGGTDLHSNAPVIADVVNTSDLSSFSAYGVEACYRFHGYSLQSVKQIDLGGGISGQTLSYTSAKDHQDWSIVYWIWPVKNGTSVRYERVILYALSSGGFGSVKTTGTQASTGALVPTKGSDQLKVQASAERGFLIAFAREVIQAQAIVAPGSQLGRNAPELTNATTSGSPVKLPLRRRPSTATSIP